MQLHLGKRKTEKWLLFQVDTWLAKIWKFFSSRKWENRHILGAFTYISSSSSLLSLYRVYVDYLSKNYNQYNILISRWQRHVFIFLSLYCHYEFTVLSINRILKTNMLDSLVLFFLVFMFLSASSSLKNILKCKSPIEKFW